MTLSVVTGKPGHGKTLYAVTKIEKRAREENRRVYYNGINGLKLDWSLLEDATSWHDPAVVPDGAIIVIDEAQRTFPPRSTGSKVPAHVQPFDTHRHRGLDIYLITQDPMLIDSFARNLAGEHIHVLRPFGTQQAKVFRWEHVVDPDSRSERKLAVDTEFFRYPKQSFNLYDSATVHTVKRKLPWKLAVGLPILAGVLALSLVIGYKTLNNLRQKKDDSSSKGSGDLISTSSADKKSLNPEEYKKLFVSRLPDHPESAPIYDDLAAKPAYLPVVAGCVAMGKTCRCYTQQGTPLPDFPAESCRVIVEHGAFIAYEDKTLGLKPAVNVDADKQRMQAMQNEIDIRRLSDQIQAIKDGRELAKSEDSKRSLIGG